MKVKSLDTLIYLGDGSKVFNPKTQRWEPSSTGFQQDFHRLTHNLLGLNIIHQAQAPSTGGGF